MHHAVWLVNASRRTFLAVVPVLVRPDDAFARAVLPDPEFGLYRQMDARDRQHACEVAKRLLADVPAASPELVRAALLHDVGKAGAPYRPFERILVHLYTPADLPLEPRLNGVRGAWQRKLHHAHYGAEKIRAAGGDARVAELVARHHQPAGDRDAAVLHRIERLF